jgi:hypothetical protein
MRFFLLTTFVLIALHTAFSAFERTSQGARTEGIGGVSVALDGSLWSALSNPPCLVGVSERSLSLYYSPEPFGIKELARGSFSFVEPTDVGAFALSGSRFGFELYREVALTLSYATSLTDQFSVGGSVNYYSLSISEYGSAATVGLDLGVLLKVSDDIRWGAVAYSVNAPRIGEARERLPQVYATGVAYKPLAEATIAADLVKDIRFPAELHLGLEYTLLNMIDLRGGAASDPGSLNAGIGIRYEFINLDYAFANHTELGMTHQFSISLLLGRL